MIDGEMKMQQKDGGFVVPAGGDHVLEPGNDHVMVMDMSDPVEPGEDVEITLTLDDGTTYTYTARIPADRADRIASSTSGRVLIRRRSSSRPGWTRTSRRSVSIRRSCASTSPTRRR